MKIRSMACIVSVAAGLSAFCLDGHALDSLFPREHPSLSMTLSGGGGEIAIAVDQWQHWTLKKRPKAEIEKELRNEISSYVFVTPEDRAKLERTNSLLGYSGEGKFILHNGIEIPWKQNSSILSVRLAGRNVKSEWQDFAPETWVTRLEKERGRQRPTLSSP